MKHYSSPETVLRLLEEKRQENIQQLSTLPMEKLIELKKIYSKLAEEAMDAGRKEGVAINKEKSMQLFDAMEINRGNDEQAWDFLS